jgi:hypothetical protein
MRGSHLGGSWLKGLGWEYTPEENSEEAGSDLIGGSAVESCVK